jgi:hypothetical protein
MAFSQRIDQAGAMASRWRRRRICALHAAGTVRKVALKDISGHGVLVEIAQPLELGLEVELRHPDAGAIVGRVREIGENQARIGFDGREEAVAFALGAIMADMTRD